MRMRSTAAAVLVAAGLAVITTGAASAGEPDDDGPDVVIVTCEDGEPVVREPTDEERERLRARPVPPERVRPLPAPPEHHRVGPDGRIEGETRVLPEGGVVRVVPAEPGEAPPAPCDAHAAPRVERGEVAVPAPPR
jgi:hypothetical protein